MKIKALKTFISGSFSASKGETIEVPDKTAKELIHVGFAEEEKVVKNKVVRNGKRSED